jgi:type I restriction enzyme S subunit
MIEGLKPYAEYKESGQKWLGGVPAHWDLKLGHAAFAKRKEPNRGMKEKIVLSLSYGRIKVKAADKQHGLVPESYETYQVVNEGNVIIRGTDLQNDHTSLRIGLSRNRGIISSAYLCLEAQPVVTPDYGYQILNVFDLTKAIYRYGSGLRQNLDHGEIKRLPIFLPPPDEQAAIVRFLDHANRKIDSFIRAKRKLIGLLNEQKQAIIHRAVTRGLHPDVPLKPSGIPWLGDIPKHWEVKRLRHACEMRVSNVDKHTKQGETPVRLCNYVEVYKNERISESTRFMAATANQDECVRFRLRKGDVLITKDSEEWNDIGVPALVEYEAPDLVCGYHLALLRPRPGLLGSFLHRALDSRFIATQFHVEANGVTRYGLSQGAILGVSIPIPPPIEQQNIVNYLDAQLAARDTTIARTEREIALMQEYRTRLTADLVTGKLDVREAAAQLPAPPADPAAEENLGELLEEPEAEEEE